MSQKNLLHKSGRIRDLAILFSLALLLGGLLLATPGPGLAAPPAQSPDAPPSVSAGRGLWAENCLPCHGLTGRGDGPTAETIPNPLPDFSDPQTGRQLVPAEYFNIIKNGRMDQMMPPWGNRLTDAQIWDAAAFVWSLSTSPQNLAAGAAVYQQQCAACHGESGAGDGPDAPDEINNFTDLPAMVQQSQADLLAAFRASDRHADLSGLPEADLWQALDHIRTFSFDVTLPKADGVLSGRVINATTGQPVGNVEVTLHVFQNNTEIDTRTAQAASDGSFTFENLSTEHSVLYMLEGRYQDIVYLSDEPGIFTPDTTQTTLDLNVYEPTTSDEAINITQLHYLISFSPNAVNAVQVFVVGNSGNQTYIGQNGQTFAFSVPDGANGVVFQNNFDNSRFIQTDTGYVDTEPVVPGREGLTIVASYDIPFEGDSLTINLPIPDDTNSLNVLVTNQGATLTSNQVQFVETREAQGSEFSIYRGGSLAKGETLTLQLTNLDNLVFEPAAAANPGAAATAVPAHQGLLRWIIIGLGGLAIVGAGVAYPMLRPQAALPHAAPDTRRQKLLLTLARLDDLFEAGDLDEAVYRQARAQYKAELARLMEDWA